MERAPGNKPALIGMPVAAGPANDAILCDSGSVAYAGSYVCNLILGATVNAGFTVARRNAANNADISGHVFVILTGANTTPEYVMSFPLEANERIVVRSLAGNAGNNYVAMNLEHYA